MSYGMSLGAVEGFQRPVRSMTITFLSLADVRPVPRPVVPYGYMAIVDEY